jgi:hypothetical protein
MTVANSAINFHPQDRRGARARAIRLHGLALIFFSGIALLALYGQIVTTGTHVSGFDFFNYHWNQWFIRHSFAHPDVDLWFNNYVMFPAVSNYGYHALAAVWHPLWAILEPAIGTLVTVNLIILIACILNGYLTFALLRAEDVHPALALIGGAALQVLPIARYFYANTHLNLMDWFWLPGLILLWRHIVRVCGEPRAFIRAPIWGAVFGVALWGLLLTDLQFPIFAAFVLVPYGLWTAWRTLRDGARPFGALAAAAAIAVVVGLALMGYAGPLAAISQFRGQLEPGPVTDRPGIPFPDGFLAMADRWWEWDHPSLGPFVPLVTLAALIAGFVPRWRRRMPSRRWLWLLIALPPLIVALGPTLHIADTALPLPYRWLYDLTGGNFRMPWRLGPAFTLAALVFAGLTFTPLLDRFRPTDRRLWIGFALALAALLLSVRIWETAPLTPVPRDYAIYHQIGAENGPPYDSYVILDAPTAAGTGEVLLGDPRAIQLQWYGIIHGKRMFNGFISRAPVDQFWGIMGDDPLMSWLGGRRALNPEAVRAALIQRVYGYPIGYLLVHSDLFGREAPIVGEIVGYLNGQADLFCPPVVEDGLIAFRTQAHPDDCPVRFPADGVVDIGASGDQAYLGWGWHYAEAIAGITARWSGADFPVAAPETPRAVLYVDLPAGIRRMTITAQAFIDDRRLTVTLDGQPLTPTPLTVSAAGLAEYTIDLPLREVDRPHAEIALIVDAARQPSDDGRSADQRPLALLVDRVAFTDDEP